MQSGVGSELHVEKIRYESSMSQRIKIIKLAEREQQQAEQVAKPLASVSSVAQEKARDAAATIADWISELREQKQHSAEATRSVKSLFGGAA